MKKNNIFVILFMMLVVTSCQSVKNALSGVKEENSDEFLVQKKNPLVLPPDFTDLPEPFEESSLDSGTVKSIAIGIGLGLLGCFGYNKWK